MRSPHRRLLLDLHAVALGARLGPARRSGWALGSLENGLLVEQGRVSEQPARGLASHVHVRETVDTHAGLGWQGVVRWLEVNGAAGRCWSICE